MADQTPSFAQVLRDSFEQRLSELHTAMPGEIVSFDKATHLATVQPCLKRKYTSGELVDLPPIPNVPVLMPRGGGGLIEFELEKGDPVFLIFAERSVDAWISSGGKVDPDDPRKHALSDAFAYPGGYPKAMPPSDAKVTLSLKSDGSVVTKNENGTLTFTADGGLTIENGGLKLSFAANGKIGATAGGTDFFGQLLKALDKLVETTKVATSMGLQPFIPDPGYLAERAKLDPFVE